MELIGFLSDMSRTLVSNWPPLTVCAVLLLLMEPTHEQLLLHFCMSKGNSDSKVGDNNEEERSFEVSEKSHFTE